MFEWQDQIEIWGFCDQMETSQPVEKHLEQMQKQANSRPTVGDLLATCR